MAMNLKPLADRVIVEPLEKDEVTSSGIYLPETAKQLRKIKGDHQPPRKIKARA